MRVKGKIASWNDDKGYGFITPLTGGKRVFIHISALGNRNRRPELNEVVTYSVSRDAQGRPRAADATLAGDKLVEKVPGKSNKVSLAFLFVFVIAIGAGVAAGGLSVNFLVGYAALSLVTFFVYAFDKSAAQKGGWRTSEGALLLLGLAGGWPGGLIAQETLRHKSRKTSFRAVFWATVLTNLAALAWIHTVGGKV